MNGLSSLHRLRCAGVWVAVTTLGAGLVLVVAGDLRPAAGASFERLLVTGASWALCLAATWASAVTGLVALEAASSAPEGRTTVPGIPAPVHRLVLRLCGVALAGSLVAGVTTTPAIAGPGTLTDPRTQTGQVDQAPPPPVGPVSTGAVARVALDPDQVTSRRGDSLWRLAEAELRRSTGREPNDAEVVAYWPRIHAANRVLLGPDPDFLLPGVPIQLPAPPPAENQENR